MAIIKPTVGRVVWFHPNIETDEKKAAFSKSHPRFAKAEICAALIAAVLEDGSLNLAAFDADGHSHPLHAVPLIQDGQEAPAEGPYATWMPYQIGQAAKTEEVEKAVAAASEKSQSGKSGK